MIVGLRLDAEEEFVSKYDKRPEEGQPGHDDYQPTKWRLGTIDSRVLGLINDKAMTVKVDPKKPDDEVDTSVNSNAVSFLVCQHGIKGWEGFNDEDGQPIVFRKNKVSLGGTSYSVVSSEVLRQVPGAVITELANKIQKGNNLSDEEGNE